MYLVPKTKSRVLSKAVASSSKSFEESVGGSDFGDLLNVSLCCLMDLE
jgi:hypothetical protein